MAASKRNKALRVAILNVLKAWDAWQMAGPPALLDLPGGERLADVGAEVEQMRKVLAAQLWKPPAPPRE